MNIFILFLIIVAGIVALLLIIALLTKKDYNVQSEVIINASNQKVFDYIKQLKNQDHFNKWVMVDPDMKRDFKGTDGTIGFIYGWNGNKRAGEGEQEIKSINEGKNTETEIRFARPFAGIAHVNMSTKPLSDNQTKVKWSNTSKMMYPMNILLPLVEKMLMKDMDESLNNLKRILEK